MNTHLSRPARGPVEQAPRVSAGRETGRNPPLALAVLLLAALLLAGCSAELEGPSAEQLGELYFEALKTGDYSAAAALYDQGVPRDGIIGELVSTRERYGELEAYTMTDLVSYIGGGTPSYTLKYKTRYAHHHATETLLIQPGADNRLHIKRNEFQPGSVR